MRTRNRPPSNGTWFIAAVPQELGELRGAPVGIGGVRAAIGVARLLRFRRPAAMVLLGSAGSYPGGPAIGAIVQVRRTLLTDTAAVAGLGYVPAAPEALTCDEGLRAAIGLPEVDVLTTGSITTDPALAARLAGLGQVEHLEAWAAARAAADAGVPFACVLGIANEVGPDAHAQWLANRHAAESGARDAARALIRPPPTGRPG